MKSGGLLVYAPVAPTEECIALVNELNAPVEYILLPTTLFEHKLFMGPFQVRYALRRRKSCGETRLGFVHRSRNIVCRPVPNPNRPIRNLSIARIPRESEGG
jgi:hypothetical protein